MARQDHQTSLEVEFSRREMLRLALAGVPTLAEALRRLREQVARTPPGQWAPVAGGFSPWQFAEKRLPTLVELDAIALDTPVFIPHLDIQALLDKAALRALDITRRTPDDRYPGGTIERDAAGDPTGRLVATPSALILYSTLHDAPRLSRDEQLRSSRHFMRELNRLGVASALDCGGGFQAWPQDYEVVDALRRRREMMPRIGFSTFIQRPGMELEDFKTWTERDVPGPGDEWFHLVGGGEMLAPSIYDFEVFSLPRPVPPPHAEAELEAVVRLLAAKGWPFRFHAPESRIRSLTSVLTLVKGQVAWAADPFAELMDPLPPLPGWSPMARFGGYNPLEEA